MPKYLCPYCNETVVKEKYTVCEPCEEELYEESIKEEVLRKEWEEKNNQNPMEGY